MQARTVWYGGMFLLFTVPLFLFFFIRTASLDDSTKPDMEVAEEFHDIPFGAERSSKWPAVRNHYVKQHPACEACGSKESLNVHHILPFHERPELELDLANLITLCRDHHFSLGHFRNWSKSNPNVRRDAARLRKTLPKKTQSREETWWLPGAFRWWGSTSARSCCRYYG